MAEIVIRKVKSARIGGPPVYYVNLFPQPEEEAGSFGEPFTAATKALERYNALVEAGHTLSQNGFDFAAWGDQNAALQTLIADAQAEQTQQQAD